MVENGMHDMQLFFEFQVVTVIGNQKKKTR